jgi:hypothetical protein
MNPRPSCRSPDCHSGRFAFPVLSLDRFIARDMHVTVQTASGATALI